jgi:hypothetical protein
VVAAILIKPLIRQNAYVCGAPGGQRGTSQTIAGLRRFPCLAWVWSVGQDVDLVREGPRYGRQEEPCSASAADGGGGGVRPAVGGAGQGRRSVVGRSGWAARGDHPHRPRISARCGAGRSPRRGRCRRDDRPG